MKTITLIVSPDGQTKIETHGFDGQSCRDSSKFIEQVLGKKSGEQFKPEYFHEENRNLQPEGQIQC